MSQENVETVRRMLEAMNARNVEGMEQLITPDMEWRPVLTAGGDLERPVYRGTAGIGEYFADLDETFEGTEARVVELEPIGPTHVLFGGVVTARGRQSGVPIEQEIWALFELRDGKIRRGAAHRTKAEALAATGSSE